MYGRAPESWQITSPGPCLILEQARGKVEVVAHPEDRYSVRTPSGEQIVVGLTAARNLARRLADELD